MFRDLDRSGTLLGIAVIARDVMQRLQHRMASGAGEPSRAVRPGGDARITTAKRTAPTSAGPPEDARSRTRDERQQ
jgi:hypothetical protein